MALVLYDSNILIDALKGYPAAIDELAHWDKPAISVITWMEVYSGAKAGEISDLDRFFHDFAFEIIHTDTQIMKTAAKLRADSLHAKPKLGLPDAVILATAQVHNLVLITRNTKDFGRLNVRVPYELVTERDGSVKVVNISPMTLPFKT